MQRLNSRRPRGFTLIEMLVSIGIVLMMMALIVPIFQITTRTVTAVERRLAVYEAARMMLDFYQDEIECAIWDCRGNQFGLKHMEFEDTDPFTPAGTAKRFAQSMRQADCVSYLKAPSYTYYSAYGSGQSTALVNPAWYNDVNLCYMASSLEMVKKSNRAPLLADVSTNSSSGFYYQRQYGPSNGRYFKDPPANTITLYSPKDHPSTTIIPESENEAGDGIDNEAGHGGYIPTIPLLDFQISYWDDTVHKFMTPPAQTMIYFAPPPKAVRFTITVCDVEKRSTLTLSRIVRVHTGTGSGFVDTSSTDATLMAPSPYNRQKDMKTIFPGRAP